jgi:hypothetical protein
VRTPNIELKWYAAATVMMVCSGPAFAGSNECDGVVKVGPEWTTVVGDMGDYAPNGCRFRTNSELGRKLLAKCPDGSECQITLPPKIWPVQSPNAPPKPMATISGKAWAERLK